MLKFALLLLQLAIQPYTVAEFVDGRCSLCIRFGNESTVRLDPYGNCTAMFCGTGHYDEKGKFHAPPECNTCRYTGACSRGHVVTTSLKF